MKSVEVLTISGGQTKFIALMSSANELVNKYGYKPNLILGCSAGAAVAILLSMGLHEKGIYFGLKMTMKSIFDRAPITKNERPTISGIFRILRGKTYLGTMGNLEKNLRRVITEADFYQWADNLTSPDVGVIAVNASDSSRKVWMLKMCDYDMAIQAIMASMSMPIISPAVKINNEYYYDGGVRDHSPGAYFLDYMDAGKTKKMVSIYSRPEDLTQNHSLKWRKNILTMGWKFLLKTLTLEVSKNDYEREYTLCKDRNIDYIAIFIKSYTDVIFDVRKDILYEGYLAGIEATKQYFIRKKE